MKMNKIDEDLYSRQLYAIGRDAMQKASETKVLISGINGLGLEIAKNSILQGFKAVHVHDTEQVTNYDLSTNYYVTTTVGGCESPATTVTVTIKPLPAAPGVENISGCVGNRR